MIAVIQSLRGQGDGLRPCAIRSNCHATCGKSRSDSILSNSRQALDTSQLIIQCIGEIRATLGKCQVVARLESDSRSSLDCSSLIIVGLDFPSRTVDGLSYIRRRRYAVSCQRSYRAIGTSSEFGRIDIILNISPIRGLGHLRGRIIAIREGDFLVGTDIGRGRTVSYLETACDFIADGFQLIFCSRPACLVGGLSDCPILIVQSGDVVLVVRPLLANFDIACLNGVVCRNGINTGDIPLQTNVTFPSDTVADVLVPSAKLMPSANVTVPAAVPFCLSPGCRH